MGSDFITGHGERRSRTFLGLQRECLPGAHLVYECSFSDASPDDTRQTLNSRYQWSVKPLQTLDPTLLKLTIHNVVRNCSCFVGSPDI